MSKGRKDKTVTGAGKARDLGTNVMASVAGKKLTITIDLTQNHGNTPKGFRRVATSHGNVEVPGHPSIRLGLNIYDRET